MPEPRTDALVRSVESLLSEKQAVAKKERELVETLNRVLTLMGYQVVAKRPAAVNGRRRRRRGRRPGRPPGSRAGLTTTAPRRRGRPPKAAPETPRRRGRPPKA